MSGNFFCSPLLATHMPKGFARKSAPTTEKCVGKHQTSCKSPCKWASGGKRSFCRTAINYRKLDDDIYMPMKKRKTGCPSHSKAKCSSPCKWASGTKRSFCRTIKNKKKS